MPDLLHSLYRQDIGFLRIVAQFWGLELHASEKDAAAGELAGQMLAPKAVHEIFETLPVEARLALHRLVEAGGKIPWTVFARSFGELQQAGPGRRDREQVHLEPVGSSEILYYRALLFRAFFDTPSGTLEFAYLPDDLLSLIPQAGQASGIKQVETGKPDEPPGRLATPIERARPLPASMRLLDDAVTLLAALRSGRAANPLSIPVGTLGDLLRAAGILTGDEPHAEKVRDFLEMPPSEALDMLHLAWQGSASFNELHQLPGLACEGEWQNSPREARSFLLSRLASVSPGKWWSLPAFVGAVKEKYPDFQRPAGDYDSWFIRRTSDGEYLRGFESWDEVEGALIRYLVCGPLHWLGRVDLATPEDHAVITAFKVIPRPPTRLENGKLSVASSGVISVPETLARVARYQISRFCEWEDSKAGLYRYRVSTDSLKKAAAQGLKANQLLGLLAKNASAEISPAFVKALKRWELNGTEARVEVQTVLRVSNPEVLAELRRSKAGRFLGESLGPVTVIVKPGAQAKVLAALAEMGVLAEFSSESRSGGG
jgi:hypothetical protein